MPAKPSHRFKQSAVVPYRKRKGRIEILLISNRSGSRWVIPKGLVDRGMDSRTSAAKEALEEAGILGKVSRRRIGRYEYEKWGGVCRVTVFLMNVRTELPVWSEMSRLRRWVKVSKAARLVDERRLKKIIAKVPHLVSSSLISLKRVDGYERG